MDRFKTVLIFVLGGALIGNVVTSFTAPHFMAWYSSTPLAKQTMCERPQVVHEVSTQLIQTQLIGSGVGAVLFLVLGILFVRSRARKQEPTPPAPTEPTPPEAT